MMSNVCACCKQEFKNSPRWYKTQGNYCKICNANIGRIVSVRGMLKYKEKNMPKILDLMSKIEEWHIPCSLEEIEATQDLMEDIKGFRIDAPTA